MKNIILLTIVILPFITYSQNVGIGTTDPSTNLHLESAISTQIMPLENFDDGTFNPPYQSSTIFGVFDGAESWAFNAIETYLGSNFSLQAPPTVYAATDECINVPVSSFPLDKSYSATFFYKNNGSNIDYIVGNGSEASTGIVENTGGDWSSIQFTGVNDGSLTDLTLCLTATFFGDATGVDFYLGAIILQYQDDHALRIVDGNQAEGKVLVSDGAGNATWNSISEAGGLQALTFTNGDLELSESNTVEIHTLKNGIHKLSIDQDLNTNWGDSNINAGFNNSVWGSANSNTGINNSLWGIGNNIQSDFSTAFGLSNNIFGINNAVWGEFNTASGLRNTVWGQQNNTSGENATAWGFGNTASDYHATAWGRDNTADGLRATAWGDTNTASGTTSTAWGQDNTASGFKATAWGDDNIASGNLSTVWGIDNTASDYGNTVWGIDNTSNAEHATVWGQNNRANARLETALGRFNYSAPSASAHIWHSDGQLFSIGIGDDDMNRKNAITILKNGKTAFNKNEPEHIFEVQANENENIWFSTTSGDIDVIIDGTAGNNAVEFRETGDFKGSIGWDVDNQRMFCYSGTNVWYVENQNLGIKKENPTYDLDLPNSSATGEARAYTWDTYSDNRVKENQEPLQYGLKEVLQLDPKSYDHHQSSFDNNGIILSDDYDETIGLIAQEVHDIIPEAVKVPKDQNEDLWSMNYEKLIPVLVNAIKDLNNEIEIMKTKMEILEKENVQLSASLEKK